jgi:hypothetical protein
MALPEIIPPVLVIIGVPATELVFQKLLDIDALAIRHIPKPPVDPEISPDDALETARVTFSQDVSHTIKGWQTIIDLFYSVLALIALLLCRQVDSADRTLVVTIAVFALLLANIILLVVAAVQGPLRTASAEFSWTEGDRSAVSPGLTTLQTISTWYIVGSNAALIVLTLIEPYLPEVLRTHS